MSEKQSSYRQIVKATSLFGGVQVFQIIIQIIRSKFIAILLGPGGMGIAGLLTSTTGFIGSLTNFGLGTSAVKDIAAANNSGNQNNVATKIIVMQRLAWITGILGTLLTLVLSPWLSQLTFGNHDYTIAFVWISITLLFTQLTSGQLALLQGVRKLQYLAKANLIGSLIGLVTTVPLYYIWGTDGIVPGIIVTSGITLTLSWYFSHKVKIPTVKVTRLRTIAEGKNMLSLGFMISLSGIMVTGIAYIVRIFISNKGGIEQVGLYNAGFTIINTYVGMIFTAMATDYYPRLSAIADSNQLCRQTINQQAEIALLILGPILIIFLVFIKWIVFILYSTKFLAVNEMLYWAALGMFFKAASWAISFILLAKGVSKLFFWNELISNIYLLGLSLLGYHFMGLEGLGISFMLTYLLYLIQVYFVSKIKFEFAFDSAFLKIFIFQFTFVVISFVAVKYFSPPLLYLIGGIAILVSSWFSFRELDKRLDLKAIMIDLKKKFHKEMPSDKKNN
jgi:O-antigen/teichoic acid export membrane protein